MDIHFRKIQEDNLETIMHWRMREDITKYMNTDPILTLEGQKEWLRKIEKDSTMKNWVIYMDNVPIGVLNLVDIDQHNKRCSWGYYVAEKKYRSLKLAMTIEWNLYDYVFDYLNFNKLTNEVLCFNKEVVIIHKMCGSDCVGTLKEHIFKNGYFYDVSLIEICKHKWNTIKNKYTYDKAKFD